MNRRLAVHYAAHVGLIAGLCLGIYLVTWDPPPWVIGLVVAALGLWLVVLEYTRVLQLPDRTTDKDTPRGT